MTLLVWLASTAWAQVACGDTLTADTTLTADLVCAKGFTGDVLTIGADGIVLDGDGFAIVAPDADAKVFSNGFSNSVIQDLDVSSSSGTGAGIELRNTTGFQVLNVIASGNATGILGRSGVKSLTVTDTDVSDSTAWGMDFQQADAGLLIARNTFDDSAEGLRIDQMTGPWTLSNTKGNLNTFVAVARGGDAGDVIFLDTVDDVTIDGQDLSDTLGIGRGVFITNSTDVTVSNNDLSGRRRGLQTGGSANSGLVITGNDASDSTDFAMLFQRISTPFTLESNIFDDSDQGLRIDDLSNWTMPNNNSFAGVPANNANDDIIELQDTTNITFDGIDLSAASGDGNAIRLFRTTGTTIQNADLSGRLRGVYTGGATTSLTVDNTDISNAGVRALQLDEIQTALTLTDVTTDGSANGLIVTDTTGPITIDVSGVSFVGTAGADSREWVELLRCDQVTVTDLEALDLGQTTTVVRVRESTDIVVDNVRTCEARRGVQISGSSDTVVQNSQFGSGDDGVEIDPITGFAADNNTIIAAFLDNSGDDVDDSGTNTTVKASAMADSDADGVADLCDICPNDPLDDLDGDTLCADVGLDDDGDGVPDKIDGDKDDPNACQDSDGDTCDDCSVAGMAEPGNDGTDTDGDGDCDAGDTDDDNDNVLDGDDSDPLDEFVCSDDDFDDCDDCTSGTFDVANDGTDTDGDGVCDLKDLVINPSVDFDTTAVGWTTGGIGSPSVVFDDASSLFVMVFETQLGTHPDCPVGVWGIGLATSPDGITWTDAGGPLVQPDPNNATPHLFYWDCVAAHPTIVDRSSGNLTMFFKSEQSDASCDTSTPSWGCGQYTGIGRVLITWDSGAGEYLATTPDATPALDVGQNFGYPRALFADGEYKVALSQRPDMLVASGAASSLTLDGTAWLPGDAPWTPDEIFNPAPVCEADGSYSAFLGGRELGVGGFGDIVGGNIGRLESSDFVTWNLGAGPVLSTDNGDVEMRHFDALLVGTTDYLLYFSDQTGPSGTNRVGLAETNSGWSVSSVQSKVCP